MKKQNLTFMYNYYISALYIQCTIAQWATMSSQARWQYQARSHLEHIFW